MKYLFLNDIHYLFNKEKVLFIMIICCLLIGSVVSISDEVTLFDVVTRSMGTNISLENFDIIAFIMYLLNVTFFLYLIVRVYVKDINSNLENIYLRINPSRYIINKSICFIIFSCLIKTIEYLFSIAVSIIPVRGVISYEIISVFISDIIYILVIQFAFLLFYLLYILKKKNIVYLVLPVVVLMIIIPKNIYSVFNYSIYYVFILFTILLLIYLIFNKKCKSLLEKV